MMPYERFAAWRASYALAIAVYKNTQGFPREERYGITSQVRRAALSAAANIAEGSARRGRREFAHFLDIATGSLAEVSCILRMAKDLGYLRDPELEELDRLRANAGRLTWRLLAKVRGIGSKPLLH